MPLSIYLRSEQEQRLVVGKPLQGGVGVNHIRRTLGPVLADISGDEMTRRQRPGGLFQHRRRIIHADHRRRGPGMLQQRGTVPRPAAKVNGEGNGMVGDTGEQFGCGARTLGAEL